MTKNKKEIVKMQPFLRWAGGKRWLVSRLRGKLDINQFTSLIIFQKNIIVL